MNCISNKIILYSRMTWSASTCDGWWGRVLELAVILFILPVAQLHFKSFLHRRRRVWWFRFCCINETVFVRLVNVFRVHLPALVIHHVHKVMQSDAESSLKNWWLLSWSRTPCGYKIWRFIITFAGSQHWTVSQTDWIHSTQTYSILTFPSVCRQFI